MMLTLELMKSKDRPLGSSKDLWVVMTVLSIFLVFLPFIELFFLTYGSSSVLTNLILILGSLGLPLKIFVLILLFDIGRKVAILGRKKDVPILGINTLIFLLAGSFIIPMLLSNLVSKTLWPDSGFSLAWLELAINLIGPLLWFIAIYEIQSTLNDVLIVEKKYTKDELEKSQVPGPKIGAIAGTAFCVAVLGPIWIFSITHELPGYGSDAAFLLIASKIDFPAVLAVSMFGINPWHPIGFILLIGANALIGLILGAICEVVLEAMPRKSLRKTFAS